MRSGFDKTRSHLRMLTPPYLNGIGPKLIYFGVLTIVAIGFALRLYALPRESLWYDELLQLDIAQGTPPGQGGLGSILPRLWGHSAVPLDYWMAHGWIWLGQIEAQVRMLGRSEGWMRIPAVMWGTLALPVAYQLGRNWLGERGGLLFMALLACSPLHIRYSQEARPYALVVLGVMLAGYAFWRMRTVGRRRYLILLQLGLLISSLAHLFAATIIGPLLVFAGIDLIFTQNRRRLIKSGLAVLATSLIVLTILLSLGWSAALYHSLKNFGQALFHPEQFTVAAPQKPNRGPGPQIDWIFVKYDLMERMGVGDRSPWLINGLAGLGFMQLLIQKKYKLAWLLLLWLVLPVIIIVAFLVYRGAFFAPRYIIHVLPAYLILLAAGTLALPEWLKRANLSWLALLLFLLLSGFIFVNFGGGLDRLYQRKNKENWRAVGELVARNAGPDDVVIAMKAEPVINWYYPRAWTPPNYYDSLEHIQAAAAKGRRTWLILSIFSSGVDAKVKSWLRQNEPEAVRFGIDPAISVYYFGSHATREQLLDEVRGFTLPADHLLYASLAYENRREPGIARQYYQLAIAGAPNDEVRAEYQQALQRLDQE